MVLLLLGKVQGVSYFVWRHLAQEVPVAEIALSYKKIMYRKVNYSISALS